MVKDYFIIEIFHNLPESEGNWIIRWIVEFFFFRPLNVIRKQNSLAVVERIC
jgi:hypothetical protein